MEVDRCARLWSDTGMPSSVTWACTSVEAGDMVKWVRTALANWVRERTSSCATAGLDP